MKRHLRLFVLVMIMLAGFIIHSNTVQSQVPLVCPKGATCFPTGGPRPVCPVDYICQPVSLNCPDGYTCVVNLPPAETTPSVPIHDAQLSVLGSPKLEIVYDSSQGEAALQANFELSIDGGTQGINVYKQDSVNFNLGNTPPGKLVPDVNSVVGSGVDVADRAFWIIPPGMKVRFSSIASANPKQMFAGKYAASVAAIGAVVGKDSKNNYVSLFPKNVVKSNEVTIFGEVSPFISSLSPNPSSPGQKMTLRGERLSSAMGVGNLYIDNIAITTPVDGSKDGTQLFFTIPALTEGYHTLYVRDNVNGTGSSNNYSFEIQPEGCYVFNKNLQLGSRGDDVTALQKFLTKKGYKTEVSGYFGFGTFTSLRAYQSSQGLPSTGFFGTLTRANVNGMCKTDLPPTISSISPTSGTSGTKVTISGSNFRKGNYISVTGKGFGTSVIPEQSSETNITFIMPELPNDTATYDIQVGYGDVLSNQVQFNSSAPQTTDSKVTVLRNALNLSCAGAGLPCEESLLRSGVALSISGGSKGVYIYKDSGVVDFVDQKVSSLQVNSLTRSGLSPVTALKSTTDENGSILYIIPANTTAQFTILTSVNPKQLLAGSYHSTLVRIAGTANSRDSGQMFNLLIPANKSLPQAIIGEKSPYIISVTSPVKVGAQITVTGQRLSNTVIYIDGKEIDSISVVRSTNGTSVAFPVPDLTLGQHYLHLKDPKTGDSNKVYFDVGGVGASSVSLKLPTADSVYKYNVNGISVPVSWYISGNSVGTPEKYQITLNSSKPSGKINLGTVLGKTNSFEITQSAQLKEFVANSQNASCPLGYVCTNHMNYYVTVEAIRDGRVVSTVNSGKFAINYDFTTASGDEPNIVDISGNKTDYAPSETLFASVKGTKLNGSSASQSEGYNVQAYVYEGSDVDFQNYLPSNPSTSYNGTFDTSSNLWKIKMIVPQKAGSYNLRLVLYCSQKGSVCDQKPYYESIKIIPFVVKGITTQSSITVTTPNGSDFWRIGNKYTVGFTVNGNAKGPFKVYLDKYFEPGNVKTGVNSTVLLGETNGRELSYTVPGLFNSSPGQGWTFKVRVCDSAQNCTGHSDSSDNFFSIAPQVLMVSPNGGETLTEGETITIKWNKDHVPSTKVSISLLDNPTRYGSVILEGTPNDGIESWVVKPLTELTDKNGRGIKPSGQYVFHVSCSDNNCIVDDSDSYFKIKSTENPINLSCSLMTDKASYQLGDTITYSWTSRNASYASWQQDTSGRDNLALPADKLSANGSQRVTANVTGNPTATLMVGGSNGSGSCSATVTITSRELPPNQVADSRITSGACINSSVYGAWAVDVSAGRALINGTEYAVNKSEGMYGGAGATDLYAVVHSGSTADINSVAAGQTPTQSQYVKVGTVSFSTSGVPSYTHGHPGCTNQNSQAPSAKRSSWLANILQAVFGF